MYYCAQNNIWNLHICTNFVKDYNDIIQWIRNYVKDYIDIIQWIQNYVKDYTDIIE